MLNKRNLVFALGLAGAAVIAAVKVCGDHLQRTNRSSHRKALQRWEGEGGNVIAPEMPGQPQDAAG